MQQYSYERVLDQYLDAFPLEIPVENLGSMAIMNQAIAGLSVLIARSIRIGYTARTGLKYRL